MQPSNLTDVATAAALRQAQATLKAADTSVQHLAFELFSDEHWRWARAKAEGGDHSTSGLGLHPERVFVDTQAALARGYGELSPASRAAYLHAAEGLMATRATDVPYAEATAAVLSEPLLRAPPAAARTLVGFTLVLVGLEVCAAMRIGAWPCACVSVA